MAYDEVLAARVRALVAERAPAEEKKAFGGLVFMVNTHLAVGLHNGGGLLMRVGADGEPAAVERGALPLRMGDMPMHGWVVVPDEVIADDAELAWWVDSGVGAALARAPKQPRARKKS